MSDYGKSYPQKEEYTKRFGAFRETLRRIEAHEKRENEKDLPDEHKVKHGLNSMSDWYDHEFGKIAGRHNKNKHPRVQWSLFGRGHITLPKTERESFDWRTQGVLQSPKH